MKGFQQSLNETKIAIVIKRLTPAAKRGDIHAFANGVRSSETRYGHDVADEAMRRCLVEFPELAKVAIGFLPEDKKANLHAQGYAIIADFLEQAGLRLEDSLRVSDQGVAFSIAAVKVLIATNPNYPRVSDFGSGCESIAEVGIDRTNGFLHPLSERYPENPEYVDLWAAASVVISAAMQWIESDGDTARQALEEFVSIVAPTLDLKTMLKACRYDDRALLKLCNYAHDGLERKCQQAFDLR